MAPKYNIGQKVTIAPVQNQNLSSRDSDIGTYAGKSGTVADYYWITPNSGEAFYIYTVQIEAERKDIVLHEDEIQAHLK